MVDPLRRWNTYSSSISAPCVSTATSGQAPLRMLPLSARLSLSKRFCQKQQMQWSKRGAHLLLQTRVKPLNHEWGTVFKRWYPDKEG
jgi:hypothetical protein